MMFLFADCVPFPHFVQTHGLVQGNFAVLTLAPPPASWIAFIGHGSAIFSF